VLEFPIRTSESKAVKSKEPLEPLKSSDLPVFKILEISEKKISYEVWLELNDEFVRRLREISDYDWIYNSPERRPAEVPCRWRG